MSDKVRIIAMQIKNRFYNMVDWAIDTDFRYHMTQLLIILVPATLVWIFLGPVALIWFCVGYTLVRLTQLPFQ